MKTTTIIGVLLIVLGILFLGPIVGLFTLTVIWPAVLLLIGIGFFLAFITAPKIPAFLMAGSVLLVSSIPFFICTFSNDWSRMTTLWPIFIFSVSIGFFLMYFLGTKKNDLLTSALILLSLGIVSSLIFNYIKFVFPVIFIAAGLVLVFIGLIKKKNSDKADAAVTEKSASVSADDEPETAQ